MQKRQESGHSKLCTIFKAQTGLFMPALQDLLGWRKVAIVSMLCFSASALQGHWCSIFLEQTQPLQTHRVTVLGLWYKSYTSINLLYTTLACCVERHGGVTRLCQGDFIIPDCPGTRQPHIFQLFQGSSFYWTATLNKKNGKNCPRLEARELEADRSCIPCMQPRPFCTKMHHCVILCHLHTYEFSIWQNTIC